MSLLVTRIASVALVLTGLSQEASRFQARSALACVGYTTHEAELIVNHPVRQLVEAGPRSGNRPYRPAMRPLASRSKMIVDQLQNSTL